MESDYDNPAEWEDIDEMIASCTLPEAIGLTPTSSPSAVAPNLSRMFSEAAQITPSKRILAGEQRQIALDIDDFDWEMMDPIDEHLPMLITYDDDNSFDRALEYSIARPSSPTSILGKRSAESPVAGSPPRKRQPLTTLVDGPKSARSEDSALEVPVVISEHLLHLGPNLAEKLPFGALYTLNRLVAGAKEITLEELEHGIERLPKYTTNVKAVPEVVRIYKNLVRTKKGLEALKDDPEGDFLAFMNAGELSATSPWAALDEENEALSKDQYGAMGYSADGRPTGLHGGKVHFRCEVAFDDSSNGFYLRLREPTLGTSCALARRLGSERILRIKVPNTFSGGKYLEQLSAFLKRPFVVCGFVYRSVHSKDNTVFALRLDEVWSADSKRIVKAPNQAGSMSFMEMMSFWNPIAQNGDQPLAKYMSRFSLFLSTSVPGYRLDPGSIKYIEDIINVPGDSHADMTDGAGGMNRALADAVYKSRGWSQSPSALQVRVHGAKGLLQVEDYEGSHISPEKPVVLLTKSQTKILYPRGKVPDPAHLSVDVLRGSHLSVGSRIGVEVIVNLAENGVPHNVILQKFEDYLASIVTPFLDWSSELNLLTAVDRLGSVFSARRARMCAESARADGFRDTGMYGIDYEDDLSSEGDEDSDFIERPRSTAWFDDPISGQPSSLGETIVSLLSAGFTMNETPFLREKTFLFVSGYVNRAFKGFKIGIERSAIAFALPDRSGILKEGEIFVRSSKREFLLQDGRKTDILVGDVLVTRSPCKLPTDVQKMKAVDVPELHDKLDVIMFSTKGTRRPADILGGGDYDGDKMVVIWDEDIVTPFRNAPEELGQEPESVKRCFKREIIQTSKWFEEVKNMSTLDAIHQYQHHSLVSVASTAGGLIGRYSNFHEVAVYALGYRHEETRRLAHMFCQVLDGCKSGVSVKEGQLAKDGRDYGMHTLKWRNAIADKFPSTSNPTQARRPDHLGPFIMDVLCNEAGEKTKDWKRRLGDRFMNQSENIGRPPLGFQEDFALSAPFREVVGKLDLPEWAHYREILELMLKVVARLHLESTKRGAPFSKKPIEERQDILRSASLQFALTPDLSSYAITEREAKRIKASLAYFYDCHFDVKSTTDQAPDLDYLIKAVKYSETMTNQTVRWSRFPHDVAHEELCAIKAESRGPTKTILREVYHHMVLKRPQTART